jgi:copper(I)-binding protein
MVTPTSFDGARRALFLTLAGVSAGVCSIGCAPRDSGVQVERAALALPVFGAPAMLYFTARNTTRSLQTVVAIDVDVAGRTSMQSTQPHRMPAGSAAMGPTALMMPVESVPIVAGGEVRFAPGGFTGVVQDVRRSLVRGDSVRMTVRFADGRSVTTTAVVVNFADLDSTLAPASAIALAREDMPTAEEGRRLYRSNGCASCHGPDGNGDGPVGRTLTPPPRDFRDAAAFRNGSDTSAIAQTIATGIPNGGAMPLYAHLTNVERRSLAMYLISLRNQLQNGSL